MAAARMRADAAELSFATDLSLHLFGWQVPVTHFYPVAPRATALGDVVQLARREWRYNR